MLAVQQLKNLKQAETVQSSKKDVYKRQVYTKPEIASVGLTLEMAKSKGISAVAMKALMSANGKSVLSQQESGFVKLIVDEESGRLLGAHLFCERASDMISELTLANSCLLYTSRCV